MALERVGSHPVSVSEITVGQEVVVFGRLDVNTVAEVRSALRDTLDRGVGDLLVHLAQAEVHDATGLGVTVAAHHRARLLGRRLVLVDVSPRLDRLLRASRLHRVLARGPVVRAIPVLPTGALPPAEAVSLPADALRPVIEAVIVPADALRPVVEAVIVPADALRPVIEAVIVRTGETSPPGRTSR